MVLVSLEARKRTTLEAALLVTVLVAAAGLAAAVTSQLVGDLSATAMQDYMQERGEFLAEERARFLGGSLQLSALEQAVNARLMELKGKEYNVHEKRFPPAHNFFVARKDIERSTIFKFIQKMPKGTLLHAHDFAMANVNFVIQNVTYMDNLWALRQGDTWSMKFARISPGAKWALVSDLRAQSNATEFDQMLRKKFTLVVNNPDVAYPDQDSIWQAFESRFGLLFSILRYKLAFRNYFWQTLTENYQDNVMYVEMRAALPLLYDLDGLQNEVVETATMYRDIAEEFKAAHPDFLGVRLIYAPSRHVAVKQMLEYMATFRSLKQALPDFIAGFDLVAHEDEGRPLIDFAQDLINLREQIPDIKYFFHAGETNWETSSSDENLIDAVLLNTTRIGHGYAIVKHPKVMEEVKRRGIGIEISPISNQVLKLVGDMRNHPGAVLLADDYPVIISSDDPGIWDAKGLSYDFYEAFMGMSGLKADLRLLKQLALNSIKYSSLSLKEQLKVLTAFNKRWKQFIMDMKPTNRARGSSGEDNTIHSSSVES